MRLSADIVVAALAWAGLLSGLAGPASAQTIADYSRAQRAVIEAEIARDNAKAMASAVPVPVPGAMPVPATAPVTAAATAGRAGPALPGNDRAVPSKNLPSWQVSGVFLSPTRALAEIVVDGVAHWVGVGQAVPGTPWRVKSVAAQRVVLVAAQARPGGRHGTPDRVLTFPAGAP